MNRGVGILVFLLAITIGGGILTANVGFTLPILQQSTDPAASPFMATDSQAFWFIALVGFILFNVVGAGVTMGFLFKFLNKEVKLAKATPTLEELRAQEESAILTEGKAKLAS